ncbi:MAG TPA: glycoside hydrolase 43 family protein [Bryobacteraceae bacterium]|nr:glycoside hydrolase 43 family protein [Bryobacteraceae bacterium]
MSRSVLALVLLVAGLSVSWLGYGANKNTVTWGDLGDGRYRNPILKADYSDPDVIRVGDDFYLVASDFHFVGIQVLHSRDLVNWSIIGQVFHRLPMSPKYDQMEGYAEGTWAPSLRYHNGEFYLYVCTPKDGLFLWHTKDPASLWSGPVTVKAVVGWEDPCPFWDDDGQAYLIHSLRGAGPLILHKMSADGTQLLDDGITVYKGPVAEGPKLFKRNRYYYISHPEGGVSTGWQTVERSTNLYGPYERRIVLSDGPHQGGIVELPNGDAWFIGFKSTGWLGRLCYLEPVKWGADDWPEFGDHGKPVETWRKPVVPHTGSPSRPETNDDFKAETLNPVWQWNHNPVDGSWSLDRRRGLRLTALPAEDLAHAHNTLTQKLWDDFGAVEVKLALSGLSEGQRAGLTFVSGTTFSWAAAEKSAGACRVVWPGATGASIEGCHHVWIRGEYRGDQATLSYSLDGKTWSDTGQKMVLKFASWKGARFGIFSYGPTPGHADINYVHYKYSSVEPPK